MKNILIPTDFSAGSLDAIHEVANTIGGDLNILLFHAFDLPESLLDAMLKAGLNNHQNLVTEELRLKCKRLKQAHRNIHNICFRTMYGTTGVAFRNFAEANKVDMIVVPADYRFVATVRDSVNPLDMFRKSRIEMINGLNKVEEAGPESGEQSIDPAILLVKS